MNNLDEHAAQLTALGIDTSRRTAGRKVKTLMIADLDGNHIAVAEAFDTSMAR